MNQWRLIKNKLRLIYTSPLLCLMILLQVSLLIVCLYADKISTVFGYASILKKDFFLWIICIPSMVVQHKASVFSTYYSYVSRIGCKRRLMAVDYFTLAASTCISTFMILSAPLVFLLSMEGSFSPEGVAELLFLWLRYVLLGLLVQYILYAVRYAFPRLQKRGESICALPFLLFFVFTFPMEFLGGRGQYVPVLDFSAGRNYRFAADGVVSWGSIFSCNVHLAACLLFLIWLTAVFFSEGWEFWENESVGIL